MTPPLRGLGASPEIVRDLIDKDSQALTLYDKAMENPAHIHADRDVITITDTAGGRGTSKQYALRKLRRDAPELHAEVIEGNLTAHAAMVQAGYRPKTATVRTDSPEHVAAALRRLLSPEDVVLVAKLLRGET
jgi:hypothetical protein